MYELKHWQFVRYGTDRIYAKGVVEGHQRLKDGDFIHTSRLEMLRMQEDCFFLDTVSGSHYMLRFEDIDPEHLETTKNALTEISEMLWKHCMELYHAKEAVRREEIKKRLRAGELYLFTSGINVMKAYFLKQDGELVRVERSVHIGMFQDSILLVHRGVVDFRFFPDVMETEMRVYHWSDGLEAVLVENVGKTICFLGKNAKIACDRGKLTRIDKSVSCEEGLMTPDGVNGKSIIANILSKKEDVEKE